jgi:4-amino-4-deoxy-L-arabinose transferase-like glycosyltransferase
MSDRRWGALLWASAFLARLLTGLGSPIFGTDGCHYLLMADWMAAGRWQDALLVAYHPMYPLLISAVSIVVGSAEVAGEWISILFGSAATIPFFLVVKAVFGRPTAVLAGLLYAFYPRLVEVQSDVMTEGTFMFFLFGSMWLTYRMREEPSVARGAVLGAAAAGAFLTRVEGLLPIAFALGWPLIAAVRRRDRLAARLGGTALTLVVVVLMLSPYMLWVKSVRGRWALSVRPAAISAERAVGVEAPTEDEPAMTRSARYRQYVVSLTRLSMYGVLIPFYIAGLAALRSVGWSRAVFFLSFPVGYLVGILFVIGTHGFMSERYLMPPMVLIGALAAHGMVAGIRTVALRRPDAPRLATASGIVALLIIMWPVVRCFQIRRTELLSCRGAAQWILARSGGGPIVLSGVEQVSYYCGSRHYYLPQIKEQLAEFLKRQPHDYIVHSEWDLRKSPEYVAMLRSWDRLQPPLEYQGPPGTLKLYFQRVK